ncbi:hemerythrin domain-containing protein [Kitasatospora sp. NPDC057223]|uniref:hemerythrin domain-containing protein n=1 Tax=Kitasatospora sp. NPDC057223 TaxID=3346055 RepID=UPI00362D723A
MSHRADIVGELSADHRAVAELLAQVGTARTSGSDTLTGLLDQLSDLLLSHCTEEEDILFPAVHEQVPDGGALVFTSLADHLAIGQYVTDLQGLAPADPAFGPLVDGLTAAVRTHLAEEDERLFPAVREALAPALLGALGERLREARQASAAATPAAPETPEAPATPEAPEAPAG